MGKKSLVSPTAAAAAPVLLEPAEAAQLSSSQASAAVPPPLLSSTSETQVLTSAPTQTQVSEDIEVTMTEERALKILDKAKEAIAHRELETLKSILPLVDSYPDKVLSVLINELNRSALRTNAWLYIGISSVLQRAFIDSEILTKIGQASILSLLKYIVKLFNESVMLTPGDQTIPYLALDVLNQSLMNLKRLDINPLPKPVIEELAAKLKVLKPSSSDISDGIKMQREYAANMLQSIDADSGTLDKILPYVGPVAKVGLGLGFIMGGIGAIALTGSAAQGTKLLTSGATMTFAGGWTLYQLIPKKESSWYPRTLMAYSLLATIKEEKEGTQQEKDFKTLLEIIRKESHLNYYGVGLLGIIYRLIHLYPEVKQPIKHEMIDTLAVIADKSNLKPFLRKNALLALKYIAENYDSQKAATHYARCLDTFKNKKKLIEAIDRQYSSFCTLSHFMRDISVQFSNAKPTLLEEVLEDEKIREGQLKLTRSQGNTRSILAVGAAVATKSNADAKAKLTMGSSDVKTVMEEGHRMRQQEFEENRKDKKVVGDQITALFSAVAIEEKCKADLDLTIRESNTKSSQSSSSLGFFQNEEITVEPIGPLFRVKIDYVQLRLSSTARKSLQTILTGEDGEDSFAYKKGTSEIENDCIIQLDFTKEKAAIQLVKSLGDAIITYRQPTASAAAAASVKETCFPK